MKNQGLSICPLASGSRGNSVYVSGETSAILVDAGLSGIELEKRMAAAGLSPDFLSAIVVTHEHTDHIKGAGILSRRFDIPVYINRKTWQTAEKKLGKLEGVTFFNCGTPFEIGDLKLDPFSISHDAADPAGVTVSCNQCRLGIATDIGVVTALVKERLSHCDLLYLEANHDPEMLMNGPYPWYLKQRVKGRRGHLSNENAGVLLSEIMEDNLKHVILSHLSFENNTPEKALAAVGHFLSPDSRTTLDVALPDQPGKIISL
ncbi:MAG: MBL fold metallo-hydrolase [Desulfobacteraceae bacterium]